MRRTAEPGQEGKREDTGLARVGTHWGNASVWEVDWVPAPTLPAGIKWKSQAQCPVPGLRKGSFSATSLGHSVYLCPRQGPERAQIPRGRLSGFPEMARRSPRCLVPLPPPWGARRERDKERPLPLTLKRRFPAPTGSHLVQSAKLGADVGLNPTPSASRPQLPAAPPETPD